MKRILSLLLTVMLLAMPAALAETPAPGYDGPVLTFSAPRGAELVLSEQTDTSYVQALYAAGANEVIVSAAFATLEERDAYVGQLLGDVAAAAPQTDFDAVQGHGAQRVVMTADFAGDDQRVMARLVKAGATQVVNLVTIDATPAFLFAAAMPQADYDADDDIVAAQVESLEIFDPNAKLMLVGEGDIGEDAYRLAGDIVIDADAEPILVYVLDDITDVTVNAVGMDESGELTLGGELGAWSGLGFGDALRVRMYLPDVLPGFAISYTDGSGTAATRYVTFSGLDGTLLLIE